MCRSLQIIWTQSLLSAKLYFQRPVQEERAHKVEAVIDELDPSSSKNLYHWTIKKNQNMMTKDHWTIKQLFIQSTFRRTCVLSCFAESSSELCASARKARDIADKSAGFSFWSSACSKLNKPVCSQIEVPKNKQREEPQRQDTTSYENDLIPRNKQILPLKEYGHKSTEMVTCAIM